MRHIVNNFFFEIDSFLLYLECDRKCVIFFVFSMRYQLKSIITPINY